MLTLASHLAEHNEVFVFWDDAFILHDARDRFGIDTSRLRIIPDIFKHRGVLSKFQTTRSFDVMCFLSDGSIPFLFAKKTILFFQFPIPWVSQNLKTKLKLKGITKIVCNSQFVKEHIDNTLGVRSEVITPPVTLIPQSHKPKEQIILTVGRFTRGMNMKKQEEMIRIFKYMCDKGLTQWKLILVGAVLKENQDFVVSLREKSEGYPIEIHENISQHELISYYQRAMLYWHATGFGENVAKHPERTEHFGISTVEAMSAGCVPIVLNAGGQPEIVDHRQNGYLWNNESELIKFTNDLITNPQLVTLLSGEAKKKARVFALPHFYAQVDQLI